VGKQGCGTLLWQSKAKQSKKKKEKQSKAVPLHAMVALGGRGDIAPTHS
jgi:hypothetical protein